MGGCFFGGQKPTSIRQQLIRERFHNLLDHLSGLLLGTGHCMSINIGRDARLGVTRPALDRVDRCPILKQDRDRGVAQIVEANVGETASRRICLKARETLLWSM